MMRAKQRTDNIRQAPKGRRPWFIRPEQKRIREVTADGFTVRQGSIGFKAVLDVGVLGDRVPELPGRVRICRDRRFPDHEVAEERAPSFGLHCKVFVRLSLLRRKVTTQRSSVRAGVPQSYQRHLLNA